MPVKLAVANQKGGVGKTTMAINLAVGLSRKNNRVMLIDADAQRNTEAATIGEVADDVPGLGTVMLGEANLTEAIQKTRHENLWVLPAGFRMEDVGLNLVSMINRERKLLKVFNDPALKDFDWIVIDSPPSLNLITLNILVASDWVLVPVAAAYFSLMGIRKFLETIETVRSELNTDTKILGFVPTLWDVREKVSREVQSALVEVFKEQVFPPIRVNTQFKSAPGKMLTAWELNSDRGLKDYETLTSEVIERAKESKNE